MGGDLQAEPGARGPSRALNLRRLYAALVFLPLFYLLVRHAPPVGFFLLVLAAALTALTELYGLHFRDERPVGAMLLGLAAATLWLTSLQWPAFLSDRALLGMMVAGLLAYQVAAVAFGVSRGLQQALGDSAVLLFGVAYVALTLGHLVLTRALPQGEYLIFFVFLVTWAADTGAYYVGVSLGRRPLAPAISPNKTVEGLLGGLGLAVVAALLARAWFLPALSLVDCVALGLLLTAAGLLGDLSESVLKRGAGVKDSGSVIPGHGGMLDRLDSLLFAAPAFYYYVTIVKEWTA
jgi:phosphatidate cytidylyltransferase